MYVCMCYLTFLTGYVECSLSFIITLIEDKKTITGLQQLTYSVVTAIPVGE